MKSPLTVCIFLLLTSFYSIAQSIQPIDSLQQKYLAELRVTGNNYVKYFNANRNIIHALPEKAFITKIDSLKQPFTTVLNKYAASGKNAKPAYIKNQQQEIHYFFEKLLLDYPYFHEVVTGKKTQLSPSSQKRLAKNLADLNRPAMLSNPDFKEYVRGFLRHKSSEEQKKAIYKKMDNQRLNSTIRMINAYITNPECRDFWQYDYIYMHIEDLGVKNLESIIALFDATCKNVQYKRSVDSIYADGMKERSTHLITTYKSVGGFDLEIHLFLPDSQQFKGKRPVIAYFSGGSWTTGNPEWAFYGAADYAKKGWIGASVEYRLADRQNTTPFEAVMDARSAIRWLRKNADLYHIDTSKIVASGNSAGGHIVLTTALADKWNESTDDLRYSASPNLLLVNSGVYDFIGDGTTTWVSSGLKDKNTVREISPAHLVRKGLAPMLIIHGTEDHSVPYVSAKLFESEMIKAGNDFEFHTLEGASHEIWRDRRFSGTVSKLRTEFLKKYGYE